MPSLRRLLPLSFPAGIVASALLSAAIMGCSAGDPAGEPPTKEEVVQRRKNKEDALKQMLNPTNAEEKTAKGSKPTTRPYQDL